MLTKKTIFLLWIRPMNLFEKCWITWISQIIKIRYRVRYEIWNLQFLYLISPYYAGSSSSESNWQIYRWFVLRFLLFSSVSELIINRLLSFDNCSSLKFYCKRLICSLYRSTPWCLRRPRTWMPPRSPRTWALVPWPPPSRTLRSSSPSAGGHSERSSWEGGRQARILNYLWIWNKSIAPTVRVLSFRKDRPTPLYAIKVMRKSEAVAKNMTSQVGTMRHSTSNNQWLTLKFCRSLPRGTLWPSQPSPPSVSTCSIASRLPPTSS